MLYFNFKDYEEFKELFGIVEHGNGVKSRKNKILLALYKDKKFLKSHIRYRECESLADERDHLNSRYRKRVDCGNYSTSDIDRVFCLLGNIITEQYPVEWDHLLYGDLLAKKTLPNLKSALMDILTCGCFAKGWYRLKLNRRRFYSDKYETDDMVGLCEDGTLNAIRYKNMESRKVFKMKAGKMFNHILECNKITCELPEQIKRWLSEEFVADWIEYARQNMGDSRFELHVNDNFEDIYDSYCCAGYDEDSDSFGSCMVGDVQWTFYRDAVDAKAAYLTDPDDDDKIVARCIVFTNVRDRDGNIWRLAERQYSKFCEPALQRQLINALIRGGYIDGYKRVGAACSDATGFLDNGGDSLEDKHFSIRCSLENGDTISYQDSFKWYNPHEERAYNYDNGSVALDVTDYSVGFGQWSRYNEEYLDEDDAYYVNTRDDYFRGDQVVDAEVYDDCGGYYSETCFEDDCIYIGGTYYYAGDDAEYPEDYGIYKCPHCGEHFTGASCYSELTEEDYCCQYCMEVAEEDYKQENWHYSEYDDEYYEDEDDVVFGVMEWNVVKLRYHTTSISRESLDTLLDNGGAAYINGVYYIDEIGFDGEPVHYAAEFSVAS